MLDASKFTYKVSISIYFEFCDLFLRISQGINGRFTP